MDYLDYRELYHHGIKGQKWGIRKYQNEDGSLTPAGRSRYGVDEVTGETSYKGRIRLQKDHDKAIQKLQKQAHKEDPTRRKESTGKNWDETYARLNTEIEKYKNDERSIFDSAKSLDDITNIFNEEYLTASLKDLKVKNVESAKKLFAQYKDEPAVRFVRK